MPEYKEGKEVGEKNNDKGVVDPESERSHENVVTCGMKIDGKADLRIEQGK